MSVEKVREDATVGTKVRFFRTQTCEPTNQEELEGVVTEVQGGFRKIETENGRFLRHISCLKVNI